MSWVFFLHLNQTIERQNCQPYWGTRERNAESPSIENSKLLQ